MKSSPDLDPEKARKRICMVAYTPYRYDGRVRLEAESLVEWGYEVFFLVPKDSDGEKARSYDLRGVKVIELNVVKYGEKNKGKYLRSYLTFLVFAFVACTRLFFRHGIRVVHVHNMPNILVFAGLVPRFFGCKLVLDVHDTIPETYAAKFGRVSRLLQGVFQLEEKACCALAHRVICVNHVQRELLIKRGVRAEKIAIVITMPRFSAQAASPKTSHQRRAFRMVNHGTMSWRLGNDLIVRAAARLVREIPEFELHIIGGGDGLNDVVELSKSLGLTDCVHFHDGVHWDKLAKTLEMMDVGIVANRVNEATELMLPSKLIDYAVLGIPAVVPKLKAIEYYFSEEMVSYFEPENVDSIVEATLKLYRDQALREQQANNARSFPEKYSWDNYEGGLRDLYSDLCANRRPKSGQLEQKQQYLGS